MTPSLPAKHQTHLFVAGTGLIGTALLSQIQAQAPVLAKQHNRKVRVVAIANSRRSLFGQRGLRLDRWQDALDRSTTPMNLRAFVARITATTLPNRIFVDCTASDDVARFYPALLAAGVSVVTASKRANSGSLGHYRQIRAAARRSGAQFRYETNVGAGLPVIGPLQAMLVTGDTVTSIDGVLSGTLSYLFNTWTGKARFSQVVREAHALGYTEPDPRDDLSGTDVARKLLILARELGLGLELADVAVESLVPASCQGVTTTDAFFTALACEDDVAAAKQQAATNAGKRLRYLASLRDGVASVRLAAVGPDHPFWALSGSDNVIAIRSARYDRQPLVIRGPGAGADVTAAGVFSDILKNVGVL